MYRGLRRIAEEVGIVLILLLEVIIKNSTVAERSLM